MRKRFEWIDNIRGVMIILVALGHIITDGSIDNTFNSIMRMPTFFMISGYLFKFKPRKSYFKHKVMHLLVPYLVYLIPVLAIQMFFEEKGVIEYIARLLLGGPYLYAWTGVFWFITCLFFTQQIFNLFSNWKIKNITILMIIFLLFSYVNDIFFPSINIPLSINLCLYSCPLFFMGFLFKKIIEETSVSIVFPISILFLIFLTSTFYFNNLYINMKIADYGVPFLSFILSVISAFCCILIFKPFKNFHLFSFFGRASMVIMYLHLPFNYFILYIEPNLNPWLILSISVLTPTLLYYVFKKNPISRKYLLGE
ncbi:acyltransferase family protein [Zobellia galactanivorans]|uniref:O-acetyltransferase n=1 Tax=Zobellia galactanivorans (strain DSM 12802 / CCUG 47099 / CIP 106680 / NCIMB 13871 / Dsij) TaxID=63186 RepID=G0L2S8_ZOBGA|nr:O-acetyltransferase [Zobellia galactanivorans]